MNKKNGKNTVNKVVLAYSGGLDTSVIVTWLIENYGCEVICYTADVGQEDELAGCRKKQKHLAQVRFILRISKKSSRVIISIRWSPPARFMNAIISSVPPSPARSSRNAWCKSPIKEGADAIAHGCTGKGNDQVRFELTVMALDPSLKVIAPWREWDITSREDALAYAQAHKIPVSHPLKSIYSRDRNLWHISHEGGILEETYNEPYSDMFQLTVSPE